MRVKISSKFLVFPVNKEAAMKRLCFLRDGKEVYGLNIRLDNLRPDFFSFVDVGRFMGEELELSVDPDMPIRFTEADQMKFEDEYREPLRPTVHFTTKNGWNNDPNGLVYIDGVYHLFYQYNPCATQWNNMHWGHAVSPDLLHWEEKDIALFPDEMGTMYSGGAIEDTKNLLGHNSESQNAMVLFYTATKQPRTQCMAYSTDSGKSFIKYNGNPVVPHMEAYNRDPKVVWCEEMGCYIMALYLNQDRYALLSSDDFVKWKQFQEITLAGDSECPDLFPLRDSDGNRRWILMGASDKYLVGVFEKGQFVPLQSQHSLHFGKINYAAQVFNGTPDERIVRIAWNKLKVDGGRFSQQMGFPTEMALEKLSGEYYLSACPADEIHSLIKQSICKQDLPIDEGTPFAESVPAGALLVRLKANREAHLTISVFGGKIAVMPECNELKVLDSVGPLSITEEDTDLTILIDRCSMEVFADGGKICFTERFVCDFNLPSLVLEGNGQIQNLQIHTLKSIWEEEQ